MIRIQQSELAQSPAAAGIDLSSELIVRMPYDGIAMYIGTREALESEGIIPPKTEWPQGFNKVGWRSGRLNFQIRRRRPEGIKGPRRDFLGFNWWECRIEPTNAPDCATRAISRKTKELNEAIRAHSAKGRAESMQRFRRAVAAYSDDAYLAFKALIPGLVKSKRAAKA